MTFFRTYRKWLLPLSLAAIVIGAVASVSAYRYKRFQHFAIHEPGMIYRSAWLEPDAIAELIEEYQFRTVINLCRPGEMGEERWKGERQVVTNSGAQLLEVSMPLNINPQGENSQPFIDIMSNPDNYPMLVHCQHGVTRTDKFMSIYDILFRGMSANDSLQAMPLFGRDEHNVHVTAFARQLEKQRNHFNTAELRQNLSALHQ